MSESVGTLEADLKLDNSGFLKGIAGAIVSAAALKKALDMAQTAQSTNTARQAFVALGGDIERLRKATSGMVADAELFKKANLAETMGITNKQFETLAQVAQAASAKTGQSMQYMLESIIVGTARQSKLILDNLGIIISVEKANETYAASLGKTADALTDAESKQAFMNAVMAKGNDMMRQMASSGVSMVNPIEQMSTAVANATDKWGQMFAAITVQGNPSIKDLAESLGGVAEELKGGDWSGVWEDFNAGMKTAAFLALDLGIGITAVIVGIRHMAGASAEELQRLGSIIESMERGQDRLNGGSGSSGGPSQAQVEKRQRDFENAAQGRVVGDGIVIEIDSSAGGGKSKAKSKKKSSNLQDMTFTEDEVFQTIFSDLSMSEDRFREYAEAVKRETANIGLAFGMSEEEFKKYVEAVKKETSELNADKLSALRGKGLQQVLGSIDGNNLGAMVSGGAMTLGVGEAGAGILGTITGVAQKGFEKFLDATKRFVGSLEQLAESTIGVVAKKFVSGADSRFMEAARGGGGALAGFGGTGAAALGMAGLPGVGKTAALGIGGLSVAITSAINPLFGLSNAAILATPAVVSLGVGFALLSMETKSFKDNQAILSKTVGLVVTKMEPMWQSMLPVTYLFYATTEALLPLLTTFVNTEGAARIMFDGVKGMALGAINAGIALKHLEHGAFSTQHALLVFAEDLARKAGNSDLASILEEEKGAAFTRKETAGNELGGMYDARQRMDELIFESSGEAAKALLELSDAAKETTRNLPSGYNAGAARRSDAMSSGRGSQGRGGISGRALLGALEELLADREFAQNGTGMGWGPQPYKP